MINNIANINQLVPMEHYFFLEIFYTGYVNI